MTKSTLTPQEIYRQYESLLAVEATYAWAPTDRTQEGGVLSLGATSVDKARIGVRYLMPAANPTVDNVIVCENSKNLAKYIQKMGASPTLWLAVDGGENTLVLIGDADLLSHLSLPGIADDAFEPPELTPGVKYSLAEIGAMLTGQDQAKCVLRLWLESVATTLRHPYAVDSIVYVETPEEAQKDYPNSIFAVVPVGTEDYMFFIVLIGAESKGLGPDVKCPAIVESVVTDLLGKLIKKFVTVWKKC